MPAAFFVVRATVSDPTRRQAFDAWYSREHLPDAMRSFGAVKAWRYWSATDPSLHEAMYQFTDKAALDRAIEGPDMKRLVADFNRDWPDVTRTREVLVLAEERAAQDARRRIRRGEDASSQMRATQKYRKDDKSSAANNSTRK
ncbi:hypothetical protein V1292_004268 [Bradyrhizobium sp. AZCC 1719]